MQADLSQESLDAIEGLIAPLRHVFDENPTGVFWVSIDFRTVLRAVMVHHTQAALLSNQLKDSLLAAMGDKATLLISAFNFDFPKDKIFKVEETPVHTGAFGGLLVQDHAKNRLLHPFYSFFAFGAREEEFLAERFAYCSGKNSIFEWLVENKTDVVTIGHHYIKALTSIHHAEATVGVDFRYQKAFTGILEQAGNKTECECFFYVRDLETCDHSSLTYDGDIFFKESGLAQTYSVGTAKRPVVAYTINLKEAHDIMVEDLRQEEPKYIDYYGPKYNRDNVISGRGADKLYKEDLIQIKEKS